MAIKKKSSEAVDGVFAVSSEDLSIVWDGGIYNFTAGNPLTIPSGLLEYLAKSDKVHAVYSETPVQEVEVVEETEVVETPEEPTEEVL
jgi:hypothetical protein